MKEKRIGSIIILLMSLTAQANVNKELAKCAQQDGDLKRLDCYDTLTRNLGLAKPIVKVVPIAKDNGKWTVSEEIDPVTDNKSTYVSITADSGTGKYGNPIQMTIRCMNKKTSLFVNFETFLTTDYPHITYRIGKSKAVSDYWFPVTTKKGGIPQSNNVSIIKKMMKAESFLVQTTPYNETSITAIFDIRGLENAVSGLRQNCKW